MFLVLLGVGAVGCNKDDKKNPIDPNALPAGWSMERASTPDVFFNEIHVGNSVTFYIKIYDENNQEVTTYDTSSATWAIEPANIGYLSDTTGQSTVFTAVSSGTFTIHLYFQGHSYQNLSVKP